MTNEGEKPAKTTEERILDGVVQTYRYLGELTELVEALIGRVDRLGGVVDDQRNIINDLVTAMPKPVRYCPPMVDDGGTVWCEGGVKLMRSKFAEGDSSKREWSHPLAEKDWHDVTLQTGGTVTVKWHNVYESKALAELPDGVNERPWPGQDAEGEQEDHPELDEDDLPF